MKINVIVPFYKNHETLDRLLKSLEDQDYKNFDLTIVADGYDNELEEKIHAILTPSNSYSFPIKYECIKENKGASYARNFGAKISGEEVEDSYLNPHVKPGRGEYLFFLDADCQLYPGVFREFINQFERNPDASFIYGNYRFDNKLEFYSQPYDPYLLETMNYISTMSPVKRSAFNEVGGFDEKQTFFQDWSLFHRLAKAGHKGKYIKDFLFTTNQPNEDNISGKKGLSLAEKAGKFRKYHNIEDKKIVVTTMGAPLQAIQRAKMLNADYVGVSMESRRQVFPVNYQFSNWAGTYMVGCYNEPYKAFTNHLSVMYGDKKAYHFIGTDVFQLLNSHSMLELKGIKEAFRIQNAKLFVNSPRMKTELASVGLDAELLYTPIYNIEKYKKVTKLPKQFTVAIYYSDTNPMHAFESKDGRSNIPLLYDVARSMPDIKFKFFGGKAKQVDGNIEWVGNIPEQYMTEFINTCSMNLRSTIHDGFPQLPIQFMLCGRHALISCPDQELKYAHKLSFEDIYNYEDHKNEIINKIYQLQAEQELDVNYVHGYYRALMSEDLYRERIKSWFQLG